MPESLKHVQAGELLRIAAGDYNAFVDAARANRARQGGRGGPGTPGPGGPDSTIVLVRNDTGEDLDRFDVVGLSLTIGGVWPTPDDNEDGFLSGGTFFLGELPDVAKHVGRFAVLTAALPKDAIGPAQIAGITPAWVNVQDADDWYADIDDGEHETLRSGPSGSAQLLYKSAAGTGIMWCLARLGHCAGLPPGTADYQVPVWDDVLKAWVPGPVRAM
jgi:hypothetical protein